MKYRLVHLSGSLAGRVRDVDAKELVLGRDAAAHVVFGPEDLKVGRRHAVIVEEDGALLIRDLDSSTGTFLEGENIAEAELLHGDVVELGEGGPRLRIELEDTGTLVVPLATAAAAAAQAAAAPAARPVPSASAPATRVGVGPGSRLRLTPLSGPRKGTALDLGGSVIRVGRAAGNTVCTPEDRTVSSQHAKIVRIEDTYILLDLDSTNGTYLNGQRVERAEIQDGDVIGLGVGGTELSVQFVSAEAADRPGQATVVIPNFAELVGRRVSTVLDRELALDRDVYSIGRAEGADLRLDSPIVSKSHARLLRRDGGFVIEDLGSSNGTYVDGKRVESAVLGVGTSVVVGPFVLELTAATLRVLDTRNRARLDARGLTVMAGGRPILDDVSLALPPGSFTAIIGPSGAGKSTLLSALNGAHPAGRGQVFLNGVDLYRSFEALKSTLGYVPQEDIVHRELAVGRSLDYTGRLRLPSDTSPSERARRVGDVLATLELSERRATPIHRLSGGQRKRVSIAAELLTEPNLLFLDEPTSGLDPGLEEALMLLLRELSYKGKTVVLVTHTLDHIHFCDAVVLMVDGRLAFYGRSDEAQAYFSIDNMVNLYARLKERPASQWQQEFRHSENHARLVERPLAALPATAGVAAPPQPRREAVAAPGALRQLAVLSARYLETLTRDARNAGLLVAQAPLIAGLIGLSLLYGESDIAYTKPKNTILFLLALTAVWFGCSNAAREIVKERAIYLRERMVNLRILPYILSKVLVLGGLAAIQCVLFLLILHNWFGIPGRPLLLLLAMILVSGVGILLGLALSALATTADRAMTLLPLLLIPQVLFTIPSVQMDMKGPAGLVARAMPTWWGYDLLRRVALAPGYEIDDDAVDAQLQQGGPILMTKKRFEGMLQQGYMMFKYRGAIEVTWTATLPESLGEHLPAGLGPWRPAAVDTLVLSSYAALLLAATAFLQKRGDRRS